MKNKGTESRVLVVWICTAALVAVIRFFNATDLGYDGTLQIQAAQNLLQGGGLAIYRPVEEDFSSPLSLVTLTHFPCAYSLSAALLMTLGASPGMVVRVIGALATLFGWWGWGRLAVAYLREGMLRGWVWRVLGYSIALVCPLLFTPPWPGTDIVLWASVPWVLTWIVGASGEESFKRVRLDATAGVLCGVCILMRYASLFLAAYAGLLILCQCRKQLSVLAGRWAIFGGSLFVTLLPQVYINYFLSNNSTAPHSMTLHRGTSVVLERASEGLAQLSAGNFTLLFWIPTKLLDILAFNMTNPMGGGAPWQLGVTALLFALPLMVAARMRTAGGKATCRDLRIAAAALPIWLSFFLLVCQVLGKYNYVGDRRYYWSLVPLAVLAAYFLAGSKSEKEGMLMRLVRTGANACVIGFALLGAIGAVRLLVPGASGSGARAKLMGSKQTENWPSLKTNYQSSDARSFVVQLMRENPGAFLLTNMENWFFAERDIDLSRMHVIVSCATLGTEYVRTRFISGPARIFILVRDDGGPALEFAWNYFDGKVEHAKCYERIPNVQLLRRFQQEGIKVLEAQLPAKERITLTESESP